MLFVDSPNPTQNMLQVLRPPSRIGRPPRVLWVAPALATNVATLISKRVGEVSAESA